MRRALGFLLLGLFLTACGGDMTPAETRTAIPATGTTVRAPAAMPTGVPIPIVATARPASAVPGRPPEVPTLSVSQQMFATATVMAAARWTAVARTALPATPVTPSQAVPPPTPVPSPATVTAGPATPPASQTITVAAGQTLPALAGQNGVSVAALWAYNSLTNPREVHAGTVLRIPPAGYRPPAEVRYVVQFGDALYQIALLFGTTTDVIARRNNLANPGQIYGGQSLIIPVL